MKDTRGKKIGTLIIRLDRKKSTYQHATIKVDLRFDITYGTFYASYGAERFEAKTKDALTALVKQAAEKAIDMVWTRYIVVEYHATAWPEDGTSGRPNSTGSYERFYLGDDRAKLERDPDASRGSRSREHWLITGIDLHWRLLDISDPYEVPEEPGKRVRSFRDVSMRVRSWQDQEWEEDIDDPHEQDDDTLPAGAVPWTAEREQFLRDVLAALGKLDARMVELFRGAPDELAARLDTRIALGAERLLVAPSAAPTRTGKTISDEEIITVRTELGRLRQNAYTRAIRKDCDAALDGDQVCRESVAAAWNKLQEQG